MSARPEPLAVWLSGIRVATLARRRGGLWCRYTAEALACFDLNAPVLSVAMPVATDPYPPRVTEPFFDGLLPEGEPRARLAYDFGLDASDTFGLLGVLGRDCAGALVIGPESEGPPALGRAGAAEPLSDTEVVARLRALRRAPLDVDDRVRVSLAGTQDKLALTRLPGGGWGRPVGGVPSTHILKPASGRWPAMAENEAFCLRLAWRLGIPAAEAEIFDAEGLHVLVVARYDRHLLAEGRIERLHQEDACQALGVPTRRKYEEHGGPSLRQIAGLLDRWSASPERFDPLVCAVVLNAVVGNADAHGKNFSLLHDATGAIRLAPLYDIMSTAIYPDVDTTAAMFVNGVRSVPAVTLPDVVAEASGWGCRGAEDLVGDLVARLPEAIGEAACEVPGIPEGLVALVGARAAELIEQQARSSGVCRW